jgi:hypothetical protein
MRVGIGGAKYGEGRGGKINMGTPVIGALIYAWGAIVYSPSTRRYTWSYKYHTQAEAEAGARSALPEPDAFVAVVAYNGYIALALGSGGEWGAAWDAKANTAIQKALSACPAANRSLAIVLHTHRGP